MLSEKVKVNRMTIAACLTCPICKEMLEEATTISECLHTFCRKCIYSKFSDKNLGYCPICNTELGGMPKEKLRPDHNMQELRKQIFPSKRRNPNSPEAVCSVALPARRKERLLPSFVVSTPASSKKTALTKESSPEELETGVTNQFCGFLEEHLVDPQGPILPQGGYWDEDPLAKRQKTSSKLAKVIKIGSDEGWTGNECHPLQAFDAFMLAQDEHCYSNMSFKTGQAEESLAELETVAAKEVGEFVEETLVNREGQTPPQGGYRDEDRLPKRQKPFSEHAKIIEIGQDEGWTGRKRRPVQVFEAFNLAQDADYCSKMSNEDCIINMKCHMGEFMSFYVRMVAMLDSETKENSELLKKISLLEKEASKSMEKIETAHKREAKLEETWKMEKKKIEDEKDGACEKLHADLKKVKQALEDKEAAYNRVVFNLNEAEATNENFKLSLEESLQETDRLSAALEKMTEEKIRACATLNFMANEKDKICSGLDLLKQRNQLGIDLWAMTKERDKLSVDLQAMNKEIDEVVVDLQSMTVNRDMLATDLEVMTMDREGFLIDLQAMTMERDGLAVDLEAIAMDRDGLALHLQAITMDRDRLVVDLKAMIKERDSFLKDSLTTYEEGYNDCYNLAVEAGYDMRGRTMYDFLYGLSDKENTAVGQGTVLIPDASGVLINALVEEKAITYNHPSFG